MLGLPIELWLTIFGYCLDADLKSMEKVSLESLAIVLQYRNNMKLIFIKLFPEVPICSSRIPEFVYHLTDYPNLSLIRIVRGQDKRSFALFDYKLYNFINPSRTYITMSETRRQLIFSRNGDMKMLTTFVIPEIGQKARLHEEWYKNNILVKEV
jgi:hypothetical protein